MYIPKKLKGRFGVNCNQKREVGTFIKGLILFILVDELYIFSPGSVSSSHSTLDPRAISHTSTSLTGIPIHQTLHSISLNHPWLMHLQPFQQPIHFHFQSHLCLLWLTSPPCPGIAFLYPSTYATKNQFYFLLLLNPHLPSWSPDFETYP